MSDRASCVTADRQAAKPLIPCDGFVDAAPITTPSPAIRAYLRSFGLVAIVIYADGRLSCTLDVGRPLRSTPVAIWWCSAAHQAIEIIEQCRLEETADVYTVARGFGVQFASHNDVVERAERAVEHINDRLEAAKADGLLRCFNRRYAELRQQARRRGVGMMPYPVAFDRLKLEISPAS